MDGTTHPSDDPVARLLERLEGVRPVGRGKWVAFCPSHERPSAGHTPSLSVSKGRDGRALVCCHAGCALPDVLKAIGWQESDLYPATSRGRAAGPRTGARAEDTRRNQGRITETYRYRDANGVLLFEVVRYDPKGFRQRRPDGHGGWAWNLNGVLRVLYRLPELLAADKGAWVFVVEGEKDVDAVRSLDLAATCNPGGAGKWKHLADDSPLYGRRVAIIPDRDEDDTGLRHAQDVARHLHGKAADVRIVELPEGLLNGKPIKDTSDWIEWLDARTTEELAAALVAMAEAAPPWSDGAGHSMATIPPDKPSDAIESMETVEEGDVVEKHASLSAHSMAAAIVAAAGTVSMLNGASAEGLAAELLASARGRPWQRGLFRFLRYVKGAVAPDAGNGRAPVHVLRPLLRLWHRETGLPDAAVDDVLGEAAVQWPKIRYPAGTDALRSAVGKIQAGVSPAEAEQYDSDPVRRLVSLCALLAAESADGIFFLSCSTAARICGFAGDTGNPDDKAAWRALRLLKEDGLIETTERGTRTKATRYLWKGGRTGAGGRDGRAAAVSEGHKKI